MRNIVRAVKKTWAVAGPLVFVFSFVWFLFDSRPSYFAPFLLAWDVVCFTGHMVSCFSNQGRR